MNALVRASPQNVDGKKDYVVVSFSGGKDSTAMVLHMIELGEHIDEIVTCDTGMEFPAMYDHIARVSEVFKDHGIKYTVLRAKNTFEDCLLNIPVNTKNYGTRYGYGWPSVNCRWCTRYLKQDPINAHLKTLRKDHNVIQCIGLAADEYKRLERKNNQQSNHRHPLVEWGWSEKDCLDYCHSLGYDWGGLYDIFNRVSCWCCPLAGISELRKLWANFPELWQILHDWEVILTTESDKGKLKKFGFKERYTVFELEKRFELENARKQRGSSIKTRGFYDTYRKIKNGVPEGQTTLSFKEGE